VAAAVRGAARPLANRFFPVEKQQLDRQRVLAVFQHAGQLDQKRGARASVVRPDERDVVEALGIVVTGDDEPPSVGRLP
jgi:hypothetical protein